MDIKNSILFPLININAISAIAFMSVLHRHEYYFKAQKSFTVLLNTSEYWYQNPVTQIILVLVIAITILLAIRLALKRIKTKNALENSRIAQMQTVLQQQMNPHFIFNSLTSINHFVLQNKPLESSRYLTKFSILIRKILDNSAFEKVSLKEEIEALEIYIELEALRFKNKFSYNFKINPDIDVNQIKIIPFIIQPFVDSAIRDNILNKSEKGSILIQFQKSGKQLICSIIDNGVNRNYLNNASKEIQIKTDKSGTQIAKQRIEIHNKQNQRKILIYTEVLRNHKQEITGNKTTIKYPIN
jgi:LytS/YehU family sensor histidine kinase